MTSAPIGATYVWCNSALFYPRDLARSLGREDLRIVSPYWVEDSYRFRSLKVKSVIVDHAVDFTARQRAHWHEICEQITRRDAIRAATAILVSHGNTPQ